MNKIIDFRKSSKQNTSYLKDIYLDLSMESAAQAKSSALEKDLQYKVSKNTNANAVKNAIYNIFTWIPGERILNPEFGSRLKYYLYEGITEFNIEKIISEIKSCVLKWEPRAQITNIVNITNINEVEDSTIHLQIRYIINGLDDQEYYYDYILDKNS